MIFIILVATVTCGVERVAVKNILDSVPLKSRGATTIEALVKKPAPQWKLSTPRLPEESKIVTITAIVLKYHKEADQDLHIVVQGISGITMIVEIPDVVCAPTSRYRTKMQNARIQFLKLFKPGTKLKITGAIFFDKMHNQDGIAPNGIELHPVIKVELP